MNLLIKNWLKRFRKYFFSYKDGFFELPFLANSPELIVESFNSMPFIKSDKSIGIFSTSNFFIKGKGYYQKLEHGCWIILSDFEIRKNLSFKLIYDENAPTNYYSLNLYVNKNSQKKLKPNISQFEIEDRAWFFLKPGGNYLNSHFKNQKSLYLNLYFDKEWLFTYIENEEFNNLIKSEFINFLNSKNEFLYIPFFKDNGLILSDEIVKIFQSRKEISEENIKELKIRVNALFKTFIYFLQEQNYFFVSENIELIKSRQILQVKHYLDSNLTEKFPSIEFLSKMCGISETILKVDFKKMMGFTIYQYFVFRQMHFAKLIFDQENISIKDLAFTFAYSNSGKFSNAFKKVHGFLPSERIKIQ
jgi:AraC-like DNA-binding protein